MKYIFTLLSCLMIAVISQAQTKTGKISGTIIDGNSKTVEAATIALLKAKDSSVVKFSVANKDGKYAFENISDGRYLVSVTAVGHKKAFSEAFELTAAQDNVEVKTLELVPQAKAMNEVVVTAKKPLIEQKIDRTVVNVEASPTNVGSSALEVLEKVPGVTVDKDGNISLKGKQGVMVLVDGRPTYLSAQDLANMLSNMNSNQLEQIEVMTNPPAKYDAAGNSGIINIKTKKNKQFGYNGSVTLGYGQGRYHRTNEGINFNYRKGKVNLFTNLSHNYNRSYNDMVIERRILDENTKVLTSNFNQQEAMFNDFNSYNAKLGMDYFASKKTTIGVVFTGYSNPGKFGNNNLTLISDPNNHLDSQTRGAAIYNQNWRNFGTNLNFRQVLDSAGQELTADLDYVTYNSHKDQSLSSYYYNASGTPTNKPDTLLAALPQNINIYSAKADYVLPLKKGARFEAGLKTSYVKTDNNAQYDSIQYAKVVHDFGKSNYFQYQENINAAYANLNAPLSKKWNAQLGLRLENTNYKINQVTSHEKFDSSYTKLFPTMYLQYIVNDKNSFGLNYGRRIDRPDYQSLNPFKEYIDRYTYEQGNPYLRPQFSNGIELSHTYRNFLTTTLNYSKTTDIIQEVIEQKANGEDIQVYVKKANLAKQRQYGLSVNVSMPVTKWWNNNLYINVSDNKFEGIVNNSPVTIDAKMLMLNGSQQFKITKTFSAEISGFFRTAGVEGVIRSKPFGMMNVGFSKQILKDKGTLRLNIRDVFYTQQFRGVIKYSNVDANFVNSRDSRVVNIGFTYRFNKGKMSAGQKRRTGGASDEQNRVGGGNGGN